MFTESQPQIRLLVADDHSMIRMGIRLVFEEHRDIAIIGEAEDGNEAYSRILELSPDVVILDLSLPKMSGLQVASKVAAIAKPPKIIILTASNSTEDMLACFQIGVHGYCLKDSDARLLPLATRSVYSGAYWLDTFSGKRLVEAAPRKNQKSLLSERELEVLGLMASGKSNKEIALLLCISLATVKTHVRNLFEALSVSDRAQAAAKALSLGLLDTAEAVVTN